MERSVLITIVGSIGLFLSVSSCDKTERATRKFIKEGRWIVTEMSAGITVIDKLPKWTIAPCDDHTGYCTGTWQHPLGSNTGFFWRFSNLGGTFDFFPDSSGSETNTMAYNQCYNFSGEYKVIKSKRNTLHLESTTTAGYPGKTVNIRLQAED